MWNADPEQIVAARGRIDPAFLDMPVRSSAALDRRFGAELIFKDETANPIRSFKGRGACNLMAQLGPGGPIVCASAGNFGQGLAWAARLASRQLIVYASHRAVPSKIHAMQRLGASVVRAGEDFDGAKQAAAAHAEAEGLLYIEDGDRAAVAEGAGTLAMELTEDAGSFDLIMTPLGNGALAAGIGSWIRHAGDGARTIAVAATGAPAMARSVIEGRVVTTASVDTIADGIAVRLPIASAVDAVRKVVDEVRLVDDDAIRAAMKVIEEELGLIVEPAGAAAFAALIAEPERARGLRIAVPLCGGNV